MMKKTLFALSVSVLLACACNDYLEPLPDGSYNEDNYADYPTIIRGFIDKAYNLRPNTYYSTEFIGSDAGADDLVYRVKTGSMRQLSVGNGIMTSNPFSSVWQRDYAAIYYLNLFLKDDLGKNTRYLVDNTSNKVLQRCLQGDAYGLRAWYSFNLLEFFGGADASGNLLGVPLYTEPVDISKFDNSDVTRPTYDECVQQILADCDSAIAYLPIVNRDQYIQGEPFHVTGAIRYRSIDGLSVKALKAKVLLTWASPAFNPSGDKTRWERAAAAAKEVIDFKLTGETGGLDPAASFLWTNPNTAEIIYPSHINQNASYETHFYPLGFGGNADLAPTRNLVDAFPMMNGYPISDSRSGYDPAYPYVGRDPRFYATVFYDGCGIFRNQSPYDLMYSIESSGDGKDAPGKMNTSPTGYYVKKYVSLGWNPNDVTVQTAQHCMFFFRWTHMCLAFAEAANQAYGPEVPVDGLTARQALTYIRSRAVNTGTEDAPGVGTSGDPYLAECCSSASAFDALVKNEWRVETCFEGIRFHNVRRWATSVADINVKIYGEKEELETRNYPSLWMPLPYSEVRKCPKMVQNAGWESWK